MEKTTITTLSQSGTKTLIKTYERIGFKLLSSKFDDKKKVFVSVFKVLTSVDKYVSNRVFDGVRPIKGKRLQMLKAKTKKKKKKPIAG